MLPSPPTPHAQELCAYLDDKPDGCHVVLSPQPMSFGSFDPLDFGVVCSLVLDLTCDVHGDRVLDEVGVQQTTNAIIFYEYVWESGQESKVKDDLLLSTPRLLYPDIFHGSSISIPSCENSFLDVYTSNHSQNTWDTSLSFDCGEEKSIFPDPPNVSSYLFENIEGEDYHFSLSPLYDSSDHEDVSFHLEVYDCGYHDLFIHSSNHNSDFLTIDIARPLVFDDSYSDEVETPQDVEPLQFEHMVMSGSRSLDVTSTSNQKFVESVKVAYHSVVHIEDQCISQFFHPPPKSHILFLMHWRIHT